VGGDGSIVARGHLFTLNPPVDYRRECRAAFRATDSRCLDSSGERQWRPILDRQ